MTKATLRDRRVHELVDELCNTVRTRFPETEFEVYEGDDPRGIYIYAYADIDDSTDMLHLVSERMAEIIEQEGIIVALIPLSRRTKRAKA